MLLLTIEKVGMPCIAWLAERRLPYWRKRRELKVLTPSPSVPCKCGHPWEVHRWTWTKRNLFRMRWRDHPLMAEGHECNVIDCECRRFDNAGSGRWTRWLRGHNLYPQVTFRPLPSDDSPEEPYDSSIPDTAQPGAQVQADTVTVEGETQSNHE